MFHYRFATSEDVELLTKVRLQFVKVNTNDNNFVEFFQRTKDYFERALKNNTVEALLAYDDQKLIGEAMMYYYEGMPTLYNLYGLSASIVNLYVEADYRYNGIGEMMLKKLIHAANERGVNVINVNATDGSEKMFRANSFASIHNTMIYQRT